MAAQGNTSGHTQLDYLNTHSVHFQMPPVHAPVMEILLLILWALTTTVSQHLTAAQVTIHGFLFFSTPTTHYGMDKTAVDLSVPVVITQTSHGSARSFLSQLQMTWSSASVEINLQQMRMTPLVLFNSTYSEP